MNYTLSNVSRLIAALEEWRSNGPLRRAEARYAEDNLWISLTTPLGYKEYSCAAFFKGEELSRCKLEALLPRLDACISCMSAAEEKSQ
jgi:hypothetical protein